jgi:multisubunit Na+/H+ antiporter MnhB subunit
MATMSVDRSPVTARAVRRVVISVFVLGIAGMIAFSIADNNGGALTAGLVTAAASVCLMVATAVAPKSADVDEARAEDLEERIRVVVEQGADEADVRALVRAAVTFGRGRD